MGGWSVEITLKKAVQSVQFWSGTAEKVDNQGFVWKFTGWDDETYSNQIHFTYIGEGTSQNTLNCIYWNTLVHVI